MEVLEQDSLRRQDVAKLLNMPVRTVDYLVSTNQIPFSRISKRLVRFDKAELVEWWHEQKGLASPKRASE